MATTILIAEDEIHIMTLIKFKLRDAGYTVIPAEDGKRALELAQAHHPDLILLDVMMPFLNGYEVLDLLRRDENTKNIPVIMLTAKSFQHEIDEGLTRGAEDYIIKPFSPNDLITRIQAVLGRVKK
jgi:two-component system, OmpR family, alkaline phosphatase synthesis response regulator PhoP